jgi:dCMP deaminase
MNKHKIYSNLAVDVSLLSKCVKYKVGTVIVKNNKIISTGTNGTSKGNINCCDCFTQEQMQIDEYRKKHTMFAELYEIHSEMNAILNAKPDELNNAVLYCSMIPCFNCLKHIIHVGIKEIYYVDTHYKYENNINYIEVIKNSKILLNKIKID